MATEITLPALGEGVESGDVLEIFVSEGDVLTEDQSIIEVETDKATVEVPTSHAGKVVKIHIAKGDTIATGDLLISVEATAASSAPPAATPAAPATPPPAAAPPTPPPVAQAPATPPPVAPAPPVTPVQQAAPTPTAPTPVAAPPAAAPVASGGPIPAGPATRRFAREVGVDLRTVQGKGPRGRITREDVLEVVRGTQANAGAATAAAGVAAAGAGAAAAAMVSGLPEVPGTAASDKWGPTSVEPASKIRKVTAAKMHESWSTVPRVTNFDDADVTELESLRQSSKEDYAAKGIKLTAMPFLIKAVSMALQKNPLLNAKLDLEAGEITYCRYVNVGVAVDTDNGLLVPALRNTDQRSVAELAKDLAATATAMRSGKINLDDLRGGTFTISNLGAIGGTYSTPIINTPEVAILLVGRSRKMPVVVDDEIKIRLMMPLSLSYDHRLVDGAAAQRFLNDIMGYLKAPARLLLAP